MGSWSGISTIASGSVISDPSAPHTLHDGKPGLGGTGGDPRIGDEVGVSTLHPHGAAKGGSKTQASA